MIYYCTNSTNPQKYIIVNPRAEEPHLAAVAPAVGAALGAAVAVCEEIVAHAGVVPPVQDRHRLRGDGE